MFRLYDDLPDSVVVGKAEYRLDLSFDNVLLAFSALRDIEMTGEDRLGTFLQLLLCKSEQLPDMELWEEAFSAITELLRGEDTTAVEYDQNGDPMPIKHKIERPDFDFDQDAQEIYAAFWQTYGIDLLRMRGKLHWYKFQALLAGLPDDTRFTRIREIRNAKLSDIKDHKERSQMAKMKRAVALNNVDDEEEEGDEYGS